MDSWISETIEVSHSPKIDLHYTRTGGAKPPILLLHGFMDNGLCWSRVAQVLAEHFEVIMPDMRGHGKSSALEENIPFDSYIKDLETLISSLNLSNFIIMGHSLGGRLGAMFTVRNPHLVRALILEDASLGFQSARNWKDSMVRFAFKMVIKSFKKKSYTDLLKIANFQNKNWNLLDKETWAHAQFQFCQKDQPIDLNRGQDDQTWEDILPQIPVPILVFIAEKGIIPRKNIPIIQEHLHSGRIEIFPKTGHSIRREKFEKFVHLIQDFIQQPN